MIAALGILGVASLALASTQAGASARDVVLAKIPEGLAITDDLAPRNERAAFEERSALAFGPEVRRVAYAARNGDAWMPVVGERVGAAFDGVEHPRLVGERSFFHVARRKTEHTESHWIWVDGHLIGPEDAIACFAVRPDGKQVAYWTQPGAKVGNAAPPANPRHLFVLAAENKAGKWSVATGDEWRLGSAVAPIYQADGESVVTCALERNKGWVMLRASGKRQKAISDPAPGIESFALSANGAALAWVQTAAVMNPTPFPIEADRTELSFKSRSVGRAHSVVSTPAVDASGEHVAFVVQRGASRTVAVDDEKTPLGSYDYVLSLSFDERGARVAFVANRGGEPDELLPGLIRGGAWFVVVRDAESGAAPTELGPFLGTRDLAWEPRGKRLAFAARDEQGWRIVCGNTVSDAHDDVGGPRFSADGAALVYGSRDGRELWRRELTLP